MKTREVTARKPAEGFDAVKEPVMAEMSVDVYYNTGKCQTKVGREIYCNRRFADTVLWAVDAWAVKNHFRGVVHVGCYVQRMKRHADGTPILDKKGNPIISGHARGDAWDFSGIIDNNGEFLSIQDLKTNAPKKFKELIITIELAIKAANLKTELVDEGGWYHQGII